MAKLFLLTLSFLFIASCSLIPSEDENTNNSLELMDETTKIPQEVGETQDVGLFNRKIINAHNKKESWPKHAPEVLFQSLGRDLSASFTTLELKSQPEKFDYAEVELSQDGLLDDAIKSTKTVVTMKKVPQGYWQFISIKTFTECYRKKEAGRCL